MITRNVRMGVPTCSPNAQENCKTEDNTATQVRHETICNITKDVQTSKIAESACLTKNSGKPQPRMSEWTSALRIGDGEFSAPLIGSWQTNRYCNMEKRSTQVRSQGFVLTVDYRARSYGLKLKHLLHYKNDVEEHAYVRKTNVTTWRSCPGKRDAS